MKLRNLRRVAVLRSFQHRPRYVDRLRTIFTQGFGWGFFDMQNKADMRRWKAMR